MPDMRASAYGYGVQSGPRPTGLHRRIAGVGSNPAAAMGSFHPAANQIMHAPMTAVYVTADRVQVQELTPLWAGPRGDTIPAQRPGRWFQLYAAGRP